MCDLTSHHSWSDPVSRKVQNWFDRVVVLSRISVAWVVPGSTHNRDSRTRTDLDIPLYPRSNEFVSAYSACQSPHQWDRYPLFWCVFTSYTLSFVVLHWHLLYVEWLCFVRCFFLVERAVCQLSCPNHSLMSCPNRSRHGNRQEQDELPELLPHVQWCFLQVFFWTTGFYWNVALSASLLYFFTDWDSEKPNAPKDLVKLN